MAVNFKHARKYSQAQKDMVLQVLQLIRGMNNSEVARECGLTNSTISNWRTRRTMCPSMGSALKVAAAMGARLVIVENDDVKPSKRRANGDARVHLN